MKTFLSWSGPRSRHVAEALRTWIPRVLQAVKPWMSNDDISTGMRWAAEIATELEGSKVGIICLTPENQHQPWVMFEAGALSKTMDQTYVCPYLFDLSASALSGPMTQFQAATANKDGTFRLLQTLNKALGGSQLPASELEEIFDVWWPRLEQLLAQVPIAEQKSVIRSSDEILEEVLENTREQLRREVVRIVTLEDQRIGFSEMMAKFEKIFSVFDTISAIGQELSSNIPPASKERIESVFGIGIDTADATRGLMDTLKGLHERAGIQNQELLSGDADADSEPKNKDE